MALYDNDSSSYNQSVKDALRRISADGDYAFNGAVKPLRDANNSYFKANFGVTTDWNLHHIIPQELIRGDGVVARALRDLTAEGLFSMRDPVKNGIWLPFTQAVADQTGLALHRGSHTAYSSEVNNIIERLWSEQVASKVPAELQNLGN